VRDVVREIRERLDDPLRLVHLLGLERGAKRQGPNVLISCPWHSPDRSPSCSISVGRDGTVRVRCFTCSQTGDVLHLVAAVHGLDLRFAWAKVLEIAAGLAGVDLRSSHPAQLSARPRSPIVELARHVDAAADSWLRGRDLKPDNLLEAADPDELLEAVRLLVAADARSNRAHDARERELDRLSAEYEESRRNLWAFEPITVAA